MENYSGCLVLFRRYLQIKSSSFPGSAMEFFFSRELFRLPGRLRGDVVVLKPRDHGICNWCFSLPDSYSTDLCSLPMFCSMLSTEKIPCTLLIIGRADPLIVPMILYKVHKNLKPIILNTKEEENNLTVCTGWMSQVVSQKLAGGLCIVSDIVSLKSDDRMIQDY